MPLAVATARRSVESFAERGIELSIVMPCLNEAETLAGCIRQARQFLDEHGISGEIVVADNGSTDGSQQIAESLGARIVDVPIRGYGAASYYGAAAAAGRYIIMGDADGSYDFAYLMPFVEKLRAGFDLVMGNRFRGGIGPGAMPFINRYFGNPFLTGVGRLFFGCKAKDFNCGLRGFSASAFRTMDLRACGMEFATEMVYKATLFDLQVCEVPTTLVKDGRSRPPHMRPWRDGWRNLRFMLMYSPRWLFLYPGLALVLVGLTLFSLLWRGPIYLPGGVGLDVHTLVYAAAMIAIGAQCVAFSVLTKLFAIHEGLLPPDPAFERRLSVARLEMLLVSGVLMVLGGLGGTVYAVAHWGSRGFQELDASANMRLVVPTALAMMLGCQLIFNGFFMSVLRLRVRPCDSAR